MLEVMLAMLLQIYTLQDCSTKAWANRHRVTLLSDELPRNLHFAEVLSYTMGSTRVPSWPQVDPLCGRSQKLRFTPTNVRILTYPLPYSSKTLLSSFACLSAAVFHFHLS